MFCKVVKYCNESLLNSCVRHYNKNCIEKKGIEDQSLLFSSGASRYLYVPLRIQGQKTCGHDVLLVYKNSGFTLRTLFEFRNWVRKHMGYTFLRNYQAFHNTIVSWCLDNWTLPAFNRIFDWTVLPVFHTQINQLASRLIFSGKVASLHGTYITATTSTERRQSGECYRIVSRPGEITVSQITEGLRDWLWKEKKRVWTQIHQRKTTN